MGKFAKMSTGALWNEYLLVCDAVRRTLDAASDPTLTTWQRTRAVVAHRNARARKGRICAELTKRGWHPGFVYKCEVNE